MTVSVYKTQKPSNSSPGFLPRRVPELENFEFSQPINCLVLKKFGKLHVWNYRGYPLKKICLSGWGYRKTWRERQKFPEYGHVISYIVVAKPSDMFQDIQAFASSTPEPYCQYLLNLLDFTHTGYGKTFICAMLQIYRTLHCFIVTRTKLLTTDIANSIDCNIQIWEILCTIMYVCAWITLTSVEPILIFFH